MATVLRIPILAALAGPALAQAPFNDSWERALPFGPSFQHGGNTSGASSDGSSSCDVGTSPDVWYLFTAEQTSPLELITRLGIDTVVSVHRLDPGPRLVEVVCDDDGGLPNFDSRIAWGVLAGTPHYVRVTGKNGQAGGFAISGVVQLRAARPANGSRETPLSIWPGDHHGYTRFGGTPGPCQMSSESAWFMYEPRISGIASVHTSVFSFYDTSVVVEENGSIHTCQNIEGDGEYFFFPVQAGSNYLIRVGSGDGSIGIFGMGLEGPECAGRTCDDPETIAEGTRLVSLVGATASGSSSCSATEPGTEVARYFRYVAAENGTLSVSTCGTTSAAIQGYAVDARLSLHAGCPADTTTEVSCSASSLLCSGGFGPEPFVSTPVTQGQPVLIRLAARADGQLTPIRLEISLAPSALATCFGDGSGTACPCGNAGAVHRGCDNSFAAGGAQLFAAGTASLAADTLSLSVTHAPERAPVLLLQGDATPNGGAGTPFADGLLCVDGTLIRLGGAIGVDGATLFGALDGASLSSLGGAPPAGSTRWYQGLYRNDKVFCTVERANLTNAVRVTWVP